MKLQQESAVVTSMVESHLERTSCVSFVDHYSQLEPSFRSRSLARRDAWQSISEAA